MENKKKSTDVNLTAFEILQALTGELPCYASPTWDKVRQEESPAKEEPCGSLNRGAAEVPVQPVR